MMKLPLLIMLMGVVGVVHGQEQNETASGRQAGGAPSVYLANVKTLMAKVGPLNATCDSAQEELVAKFVNRAYFIVNGKDIGIDDNKTSKVNDTNYATMAADWTAVSGFTTICPYESACDEVAKLCVPCLRDPGVVNGSNATAAAGKKVVETFDQGSMAAYPPEARQKMLHQCWAKAARGEVPEAAGSSIAASFVLIFLAFVAISINNCQ